MASDILDFNSIMEERRKSVQESIRPVSADELKPLGEKLFPNVTHPWRKIYIDFIQENANCTFYHAETRDRIHVLYCREKERGMWFIPGRAQGPLQDRGLKVMKEIVTGKVEG